MLANWPTSSWLQRSLRLLCPLDKAPCSPRVPRVLIPCRPRKTTIVWLLLRRVWWRRRNPAGIASCDASRLRHPGSGVHCVCFVHWTAPAHPASRGFISLPKKTTVVWSLLRRCLVEAAESCCASHRAMLVPAYAILAPAFTAFALSTGKAPCSPCVPRVLIPCCLKKTTVVWSLLRRCLRRRRESNPRPLVICHQLTCLVRSTFDDLSPDRQD